MPEDYQDIVLAAYKKMRDNGELRTILTGETTTRLKKACLKVYDSRYNPKDADILSMFFEIDRIECDDFRKVIYDSEPDDYKALCNHIKGDTGKTSEENTDLLAWLIGFPTQYEWMELSDEEKQRVFKRAEKEKPIPPLPPPPPIPPQPIFIISRFSPHQIIISCAILLFISSTSFMVWERIPTSIRTPSADEKFMYWDEDHYEPVKDDKQNVGAPIIPLNTQTLKQQRKINLPDTLTTYSLGKVWYKGFVKDHEFFTDSGAYPQDVQRVLKPLTNTILTKYTSNYRYMLTRLVWFLCAAFLISLCGIWASKLKKEVKHFEEEAKTEEGEITAFHSNELQATSM